MAVLADVHANEPALMAVLQDLQRREVAEIWYLGDFIGYGAAPVAVIKTIRRHCNKVIVGNYDLNVIRFPEVKEKWKAKKHPSKYFSFEWTHAQLRIDHKKYLKSLPEQLAVRKFGLKFLLVHGSPARIDEPLQKSTDRQRFKEIAEQVKANVVLCGHTHEYFTRTVNGVKFINPGSVGRSFDGNYHASYAILTNRPTGLRVQNIRVDYDIKASIHAMKEAGFPEDVCASIRQGVSLDDIHQRPKREVSGVKPMEAVLKLARRYDYEVEHSHQVAELAVRLFDELADIHRLTVHERWLLEAAALLHDIGWIRGQRRHHKTSRDLIIKSKSLPFNRDDQVMVAMIARYHRRALPEESHKYYQDFSAERRSHLEMLAGILRFADGLDRKHVSSVKDIACEIRDGRMIVRVESDHFEDWEVEAAVKKADLLNRSLNLKTQVTQ